MKIALFSETYLPYINGVATHVKTLKEGLEALGHQVLVVTADPKVFGHKLENGVLRCPAMELKEIYGFGLALSRSPQAVPLLFSAFCKSCRCDYRSIRKIPGFSAYVRRPTGNFSNSQCGGTGPFFPQKSGPGFCGKPPPNLRFPKERYHTLLLRKTWPGKKRGSAAGVLRSMPEKRQPLKTAYHPGDVCLL